MNPHNPGSVYSAECPGDSEGQPRVYMTLIVLRILAPSLVMQSQPQAQQFFLPWGPGKLYFLSFGMISPSPIPFNCCELYSPFKTAELSATWGDLP